MFSHLGFFCFFTIFTFYIFLGIFNWNFYIYAINVHCLLLNISTKTKNQQKLTKNLVLILTHQVKSRGLVCFGAATPVRCPKVRALKQSVDTIYHRVKGTTLCIPIILSHICIFRVFLVTASWSVFAYVWLYFIISVSSPGIVEIWEALLTFLFFPVTVLNAYIADKKLLGYKYFRRTYRAAGRTLFGYLYKEVTDGIMKSPSCF